MGELSDGNSVEKKKHGFFTGYKALYAFSDSIDKQIMLLGIINCLVLAVIPPFVWFFMGRFVSNILNEEFNRAQNPQAVFNFTAENATAYQSVYFDDSDETSKLILACIVMSVVFRIKTAYISKMLHMDISWLESRHSGHVASMLHDHADNIHAGISEHVPQTFFIFSYLAVNLSVCLFHQWDVALIMCSAVPLMILVRSVYSKWFVSTVDQSSLLEKKIVNLVSETYSCIRTVISFGAQKQTINKFERLSVEHSNLTEQRLRSSSVIDSICMILITELMFTVALAYGVWRLERVDAGVLCGIAEVLDEPPSIENDPTIPPPEKKLMPSGKGNITFSGVSFSYPSRPDVEHVAIVGSSGSGKSTLTALLLRFYDVKEGAIELGDVDISRLSPDDVRAECALVSQEPVLFDGSIADNIRYGRIDATHMDVNDAARRVGAWNFISALPEGMQTRVGDRGLQLSGGQKQRVAIARAVIRRPKVIIFDEATSALDKKHEEEVQHALDAAAEGITSITIAHRKMFATVLHYRLSTIKTADRIIVLDGGEIVEEGPPDELLANTNGRFHRMYHDQVLDMLAAAVPRPMSPTALSTMSFSVSDLKNLKLDPDQQRRAWARSSLGVSKKLGRSYSVKSMDQKKLAMPVMSRKKSLRADYQYTATNTIDVETGKSDVDENEERAKKTTTMRSLFTLIRRSFQRGYHMTKEKRKHLSGCSHVNKNLILRYRAGYSSLFGAIPVTILRSLFILLICFEVADMLEIFIVNNEELGDRLFRVVIAYISLIIVKTIFESIGVRLKDTFKMSIERLLVSRYGNGFSAYLRLELFRSSLRHGASFFDEEGHSPGRLTHKVINETASLNKILTSKMDVLIPAVVCSLAAIAVSAWINCKLTLICGFQFPAYIIVRIVQIRQGAKRTRQMLEEEKRAANLSTVVLTNMSTIKAYGLQSHFMMVFEATLRPLARAMKWQSLINAFVFACHHSFTYMLISLALLAGLHMSRAGEINIFDFIRVVLLTQFGSNYCSLLVSSVADISKAKAAAESILDTIRERPREMDNLSEEGLRPKLQGSIKMSCVEFRYPSRPIVPVLQKLSFSIKAGGSAAIVGPSGSGKSSIFALLQRMYTATSGEVMLDNINVRSINPQYLRRVVVSVGQEPTLFSFTIRENIAFGLVESEATKERIEKAAKVANIHDFIVSLPNGYDTEVGEFGAQLSGGQKQRIAIARAIIREPAVLLLDEATAALDSHSEKAVQMALERASKLCTCIHIAHRLSTIRNVDKIYVLVDGEIKEEGAHSELLQQKGLYYEMSQSS
ncbi:pgp-10 [Pristionchus pacificus]|uniref:Pgp-10 n=1 Tax=Pristionchus pacificus TaxID=54126 RepID=A0A2A6BFX8_PRIPA|nr:pgp-10 [Pristionchus pacificus]|eukprot:PDM64711.1 pgp-10 [Pristionchus pacificus]